MREDIENYWKVFERLCQISEKYSTRLADSKGEYNNRAYLRSSARLIRRLNKAGGVIGLPKLDAREASLTLNCLFDAEIRKAYLEAAETLTGEIVGMADLRQGAMARLAGKKRKTRAISKEATKAEKIGLKAEKKAEKVEQKARKKTEKAWRKAANI